MLQNVTSTDIPKQLQRKHKGLTPIFVTFFYINRGCRPLRREPEKNPQQSYLTLMATFAPVENIP